MIGRLFLHGQRGMLHCHNGHVMASFIFLVGFELGVPHIFLSKLSKPTPLTVQGYFCTINTMPFPYPNKNNGISFILIVFLKFLRA